MSHKVLEGEFVVKETFYISGNKDELSKSQVVELLKKSGWAHDREDEQIEKSIENSICYGLFSDNKNLIGFARIITDFVTTFYLMDVIIKEEYRGRGLGKMLMDEIMKDVGHLYGILHTESAQEFYKPYGFKVTATFESGESIMEKRKEV